MFGLRAETAEDSVKPFVVVIFLLEVVVKVLRNLHDKFLLSRQLIPLLRLLPSNATDLGPRRRSQELGHEFLNEGESTLPTAPVHP
jgi:hypothetical protein